MRASSMDPQKGETTLIEIARARGPRGTVGSRWVVGSES